ncbi:uncharacterized protein RB166_012878 [Leptodactylus fuscus]|uniref:uncharacterized protein LOC142208777 n=1 Tax=Leptodactylus fuscus TaxID=238119 RepID=UPI003F4EE2C5
MSFLWTFLLLALATGSVYSSNCNLPANSLQSGLNQALKSGCIVVKGTQFPNCALTDNILAMIPLLLGGKRQTIDSTITEIILAKIISEVTDITSSIDGLNVQCILQGIFSCTHSHLENFGINFKINITIFPMVDDGCVNFVWNRDLLGLDIHASSDVLGIALTLVNYVIGTMALALKSLVLTILSLIDTAFNFLGYGFTGIHYLSNGLQIFHYIEHCHTNQYGIYISSKTICNNEKFSVPVNNDDDDGNNLGWIVPLKFIEYILQKWSLKSTSEYTRQLSLNMYQQYPWSNQFGEQIYIAYHANGCHDFTTNNEGYTTNLEIVVSVYLIDPE